VVAVITLIIVLFLSLIVVRIAAEALTLTGISREAARFQARSAWTGTGFTTAESEAVVNHPVRRRIVGLLMLLRSAGLVTAASTLMLTFVNVEERGEGLTRLLLLLGALVALWLLARSRWVDRRLSRLIAWALKRYTELDTRDYAGLLHLAGEYAVMELRVRRDGWLAERTLDALDLPDEGVLVLGVVRRDGTYIGAPRGTTRLQVGDTVLLYGRSPVLAELDRRRADPGGERAHRAAAEEQRRVLRGQEVAAGEAGGVAATRRGMGAANRTSDHG
jgi:TrkA-C domain